MIQHFKKYLPVFFLSIFAFFINYHYGFIGIMPMDNLVLYNGGYKVLNGYVPFTDYWLVTGPLLDYLNAFIFYINGVSWKSYVIHASFFNLIISTATYILFRNLELNKKFSLFYSVSFSLLFYPVVGTPFVDHHSTIFLILSFYFFILAVKNNKYNYLIIVPFLFCLSFLSKQTPAAYGLIAITPLIILFLFDSREKIKILRSLAFGSLISILFLLSFFYLTKINVSNFYDQYMLFAKTIGDYRYGIYDFSLIDVFLKFKFINILIIILSVILVTLFKKKKNLKNSIIILTSILLSCLLIFHQYLTSNQNYIFFLIPFLSGIIHIFYKDNLSKKFFLIFIILMCVFATTKYHIRFNEQRKFNELEKVDLSKAIDAEILSTDLRGLKWITPKYPNDPEVEISNLLEIMEILKNDNSKKALLTDYQFLGPVLDIYDFSPNQWHHPSVSFPLKNQKYFKKYKHFFIENLKRNNIDVIYETSRIIDGPISELIINNNCLFKERLTEMLVKFEIKKNCKDFE